jgi:hypothetical protein
LLELGRFDPLDFLHNSEECRGGRGAFLKNANQNYQP